MSINLRMETNGQQMLVDTAQPCVTFLGPRTGNVEPAGQISPSHDCMLRIGEEIAAPPTFKGLHYHWEPWDRGAERLLIDNDTDAAIAYRLTLWAETGAEIWCAFATLNDIDDDEDAPEKNIFRWAPVSVAIGQASQAEILVRKRDPIEKIVFPSVPGDRVVLRFQASASITPCVLVETPNGSIGFALEEIREVDLEVSCDDFGCGWVSLSQALNETGLPLEYDQPEDSAALQFGWAATSAEVQANFVAARARAH